MSHDLKRSKHSHPSESDSTMSFSSGPLKCIVPYDIETTQFPLENLPFGVFKTSTDVKGQVGVAIGDYVINMAALCKDGLLKDASLGFKASECFAEGNDALNDFMASGKKAWTATRARLQALLTTGSADAAYFNQAKYLIKQSDVTMLLPARIGDYTDFYSSREHATNVGTMFRGKENALQPNWLHLPVGYHGRASSVVVSGTPIRRPNGQLQKNKTNPKEGSVFGTCRLMDFEIEMGFFVGTGNNLGEPMDINTVEDNIFGFVVCNDWSARDIQKFEYVPLGPFCGKNLGTTISPWVVTIDALKPFRCETSWKVQDDPKPLPYLQDPDYSSFDINIECAIKPEGVPAEKASVVSRTNFRHMYWNHKQQLVHHTVTGCNMRPGDMCASGTISGRDVGNFGSMLELSWKGTREVKLEKTDEIRKFLKDGDEVIMTAKCQGNGYQIGFGECSGVVLPARALS